ncbi:MAG: diaminopimelate epimerase [Rhodospirillaceae bacterium]|jgi:diaminopimelate epimerase|nr:diaminopimelate epimerase [Rhodospirillaceae bacterium]
MNLFLLNGRSFLKMHGLGNDFVVLDSRTNPIEISKEQICLMSDRHIGVGFDQLIVITHPKNKLADIFINIWNADGTEVSTCGNAIRCIAWIVMQENSQTYATIETKSGLFNAQMLADNMISVDMGLAYLDWHDIPLSHSIDSNHLPINLEMLVDPVGVGMGNPHAVFFVKNIEAIDLARLGPILEHNPLFPDRCNIEIVQLLDFKRLRMRVWERGVGITLACGTGACATVVAASRRGIIQRKADVVLDNGTLTIEWMKNNHVLMTGSVALSYSGTLNSSLLQ